MVQYFKLKKNAKAYAETGKDFGISYYRILPTTLHNSKYKVVSARSEKDLEKKIKRMK